MDNKLNNLDNEFIHDRIATIMNDIIGLYLVIHTNNKNRAKITIKTILKSLEKQDLNTFNKYYNLFSSAITNIDQNTELTTDEKNTRKVAFGLLTQIKLLIDAKDNTANLVEKGFCTIQDKCFYLFKTKSNNNFITNYNQIQNKEEFILYCTNMVFTTAAELLSKYF